MSLATAYTNCLHHRHLNSFQMQKRQVIPGYNFLQRCRRVRLSRQNTHVKYFPSKTRVNISVTAKNNTVWGGTFAVGVFPSASWGQRFGQTFLKHREVIPRPSFFKLCTHFTATWIYSFNSKNNILLRGNNTRIHDTIHNISIFWAALP